MKPMKFDDLEKQWNDTPEHGILPHGAKTRMWRNIKRSAFKGRQRNYRWLAAACAAIIVTVSAYQISAYYSRDIAPQVMTATGTDDVRLLRLPDGTRVWVNENTKIEFPETFTGETRTVTLAGEAYFDVARDEAKPFIITSGNMTTTVLGTSFTVTSYPGGQPEVRVHSGKVKVADSRSAVFLEKGFAAVYDTQITGMQKRKATAQEPEWKKSLLDIDGYTLNEVVAQLKKSHEFSVNYTDEGLKALKIKGTLDSGQGLDEMLQTLAFALQITIEPAGGGTYTISR
ncbi:FecR domain-containing protein [uncultured Flavobacterium sp.]|uniref:FecR family protein n=1 Tax=uncultured Flavobacterium sp. TaxID=165435 RepID=UPI0025E9237A|nr:FecR domain-containing protein [uncultured Flavobacterium sp.]